MLLILYWMSFTWCENDYIKMIAILIGLVYQAKYSSLMRFM